MGSPPHPRTVTFVAVLAVAFALTVLGCQRPSRGGAPPAAADGGASPAPGGRCPRPLPIDDSGFIAAQAFWLPVTEPMSMAHLRDCYWHAGRRGIPVLQGQLARGGLSP